MRRRRAPVVLAIIAVMLVAGCDAIPFLPRPDGLLVSVEASGGECPAGPCSSRYDVYRDGRVVRSDGVAQTIDEGTMSRLAAAIDGADWPAILARPFTGECPTAFDGQELTYTFQTGHGPVTVASCSVEIEAGQEPFNTLGGALFGAGG
jgi:hypothetical protein